MVMVHNVASPESRDAWDYPLARACTEVYMNWCTQTTRSSLLHGTLGRTPLSPNRPSTHGHTQPDVVSIRHFQRELTARVANTHTQLRSSLSPSCLTCHICADYDVTASTARQAYKHSPCDQERGVCRSSAPVDTRHCRGWQ